MDAKDRARSSFSRALERANAANGRIARRAQQSAPAKAAAPMKRKLKKAAGAAVGAAAVAGALLVHEALPGTGAAGALPAPQAAIVAVAEPAIDANDALDERRRPESRARRGVWASVFSAVKLLIAGLFTLLGRFCTFLLSAFFTRLFGGRGAGILGFLGELIVMFLMLLLLMLWLYTLLYPKRKWTSFFTQRNLTLTAAAAMLVTVLRRLLPLLCGRDAGTAVILLDGLVTSLIGLLLPLLLFVPRKERLSAVRKALRLPHVKRALLFLCLINIIATLLRALLFAAGTYAPTVFAFLLSAAAVCVILAAIRGKTGGKPSQTYS